MEKIVLFGTGKIAKKYTEILQRMPVEIEGYIDNDRNKWGNRFYNKEIDSPDILYKKADSSILIACAAREEIVKQLSDMKLEKRMISFIQLLKLYSKIFLPNTISNTEQRTGNSVVIDNFYGSWGGAEDWCHIVASSLVGKREVYLIEKKEQYRVEGLEENIVRVNQNEKDSFQIYSELINLLVQMKPFVFINVWNSELLWAAATIKWAFPEDVMIISNILCDDGYFEWREWGEITEKYICISDKIKRELAKYNKIGEEKIFYLRPFVEKIRKVDRIYNIEKNEPIKIGYPCRLVREQKRADLIPQFIEYLEEKETNYVLNIVGDGPCKGVIEEYVGRNCLHGKVRLYGKLSKTELIDFLNNQDIYLNFSEYEGTSLTMLEAMASGCVPVVTNVSGVSDFIQSGVNGLIADVGDLEEVVEYIDYLDRNRCLLEKYGCRCMDMVNENCRLDRYIDYIGKIIESLEKKEI